MHTTSPHGMENEAVYICLGVLGIGTDFSAGTEGNVAYEMAVTAEHAARAAASG